MDDTFVFSAALDQLEIVPASRENLFIVLQKTGWKIKGVDGAAEFLGIKPTTLASRMEKLGLKRPGCETADGPASEAME